MAELPPGANRALEVLGEFASSTGPSRPAGLAEARELHDRIALAFNGRGPAGVAVRAVEAPLPGGGAVPLRVYEAPGSASPARLLWIHGGGFVFGSLDSADSTCRRLAAGVPCTVVSAGYRVGPEHGIAETLADVEAAWAWTAGRGEAASAIGGDSAGGALAALLSWRLRDRGEPAPRLQLLVYPVVALDEILEAARARGDAGFAFPWGVEEWLRGEDASAPAVSALRGDLRGGGPVHLVCGTEDFLLDQDLRYVRALREAGVEAGEDIVPGMPHGFFPWDCGVTESLGAFDRAVLALRRALL